MSESVLTTADHRVVQVPMLSADECARILAEVESLRPLWVLRRRGSAMFQTLGAATYLDRDRYFERAALYNAQLERSFGWLYERLMQALADGLQCDVAFEPSAGRPGFHIFRPAADMMIPGGNRHFDAQFERIAWPDAERADFSMPLSYTLAIRLPHSGGGLNVWPLTKTEHDAMDAAARSHLDLDGTVEYIPYQEGSLVYHSGFLLHTAAPSRSRLRPDDLRLTLQGHAFRRGNTYVLYW